MKHTPSILAISMATWANLGCILGSMLPNVIGLKKYQYASRVRYFRCRRWCCSKLHNLIWSACDYDFTIPWHALFIRREQLIPSISMNKQPPIFVCVGHMILMFHWTSFAKCSQFLQNERIQAAPKRIYIAQKHRMTQLDPWCPPHLEIGIWRCQISNCLGTWHLSACPAAST